MTDVASRTEGNECTDNDNVDKQQLPSPPPRKGSELPHPPVPVPVPSSSLPQQQQLLYIDMMNFGDYVFPMKAPWNMHRSFANTQRLVAAAKNAGFVLKCFLDDAQKSKEAVKKWRSRREREVTKGLKDVPQGMTTLLGDCLRQSGVEVCYSIVDNDDTLAYHAHHDGTKDAPVFVLSDDKDFFRYTDFNYRIFGSFQIIAEKLVLVPKPPPSSTKASTPRPILSPPPYNDHVEFIKDGNYQRGTPSPLLRALGGVSAHQRMTPLRMALYRHLQVCGTVIEEWPVWDASQGVVGWHREEVPYWDPRFGTGEGIKGEGERNGEGEKEEAVTWRDVPEQGDGSSSSGSIYYDSLLAQPDAAMQHLFPECCPPYTSYPPPDIEQLLLVYFQATATRRLNSRELSEWHKHVFCCRSLVYEACSCYKPNGRSLLDLWLAYEDEQRAAVSGGGAGRGAGGGRRSRETNEGGGGGAGGGDGDRGDRGFGRGNDSFRGRGRGRGGGRGSGSESNGGGYGRGRGGVSGGRVHQGEGGGRGNRGRGRPQQQHHHQHQVPTEIGSASVGL